MTAFLWAIMAALVWGIVPVVEKLGLAKVDPLVALFYRCFGVILGIVMLGVFILKPQEIRSIDTKSVALLVAAGFLASFVAQIFFYHGLKSGDVSRIVPIAGSFPMISFLLGVVLFGEAVTFSKIAGLLLIMSGVWMLK